MHKNETLLLISIGNVCKQWSYLEFLLAKIVWAGLELNTQEGIGLTKDLDIGRLLKKAIEINRSRRSLLLEMALADIEKKLGDLRIERNRIVHGVYSLNVLTDQMYLEHHRENRPKEEILPQEVAQLGKKINTVARQLRTAMDHSGIGPT